MFLFKQYPQQPHKKITEVTTTAEVKCVLVYAFIGNSQWPLYDIIRIPCVIQCAPGRSRYFLCVLYASKLASVGHYFPIVCDPVHSIWPQIGFCSRFANPVRYQYYSLESTLFGCQLWLRIGFCCKFTNPVHSQCYSLEQILVRHQLYLQIST